MTFNYDIEIYNKRNEKTRQFFTKAENLSFLRKKLIREFLASGKPQANNTAVYVWKLVKKKNHYIQVGQMYLERGNVIWIPYTDAGWDYDGWTVSAKDGTLGRRL